MRRVRLTAATSILKSGCVFDVAVPKPPASAVVFLWLKNQTHWDLTRLRGAKSCGKLKLWESIPGVGGLMSV